MKQLFIFSTIIILGFLSGGCKKKKEEEKQPFVLFSIEDDKQLGLQVKQEIESDPIQYPILPERGNEEAYRYLRALTQEILDKGNLTYRNEFAWEVKIIKNDNVLNAFCTPGGYIYVYTGLIKYLDKADDLAGVMGHEIAHADRRHSMRQIQNQYGIQIISSILLGNNPTLLEQLTAQIAGTLTGLSFSRDHEREADMFSVRYLSNTQYACNGAASFFEKLLLEEQAGRIPEFLSTHPSPENRVQAINAKADEIRCSKIPSNTLSSYQRFKSLL
ncbi:MAG: M48 family metalloprotease [Cytophagales bacterium]|nr:M48 family metalloprotease [Cytophagales bacterium]MDW8384973.1 M48 family metalloprotease [Flammeovirgaceae bacterium]